MSMFSDTTNQTFEDKINSDIRSYMISMDNVNKNEKSELQRNLKIQYLLGAIHACEEMKKSIVY